MSWNKSEVMSEFLKIASENEILTKEPNEDIKVVEEKRQESPEKSIIEIAHPEPVYVAEARGDGALVENQIEQQKKYIEMINKMPTGSIVGRYASAINSLVKLADLCDSCGEEKAADLLTNAASKLVSSLEQLPLTRAPAETK